MKLVLSSSLAGPGHAKFQLRFGISTTCRLMLAASVLLLTSNTLRAEAAYATAPAANTSKFIGISGSVKNEKGDPLEMANVMVKGTSTGAITDHAGRFTLNAPNTQATLIVSLMGYQTQEISLNGRTAVDVVLVENTKALNEVIVIGYGTQKKADLSSSIATVNPKDLLKVPGGFQAAMQSQVPGVQITGDKIRIRGVGSINNTDPLYVVDGMIGGAMPDENNIESIQVLKDAASCAIYGARGANGVVLVTTKRGAAGKTKIDYNGYGGTKEMSHNVGLLNGQQLAELINEEMYNQNPSRTDYLPALSDPAKIGKGYNMVDALLRTGSYQKHNLAISGGNENARFRINTNYSTDKPVIIKDAYKNYGLQFISDFTKGKLKAGETFSLSRNLRNWSNKNILDAQKWSSTLPIYDPNSTTGFAGAGNGTDVASALANAYLNSNESETIGANGNAWVSYEFIPGLRYKFNMGIDFYRNRTQNYISAYSVGQYQNHDPDELTISSAQNNRYLYENTLSYDRQIKKHNISALAGITSENSEYRAVNAGARSLPSPDLLILGLAQQTSSRVVGSGVGRTAMYSVLGRINYAYDSKYMLTANFRRDASANFGKANRYGNFPSFSAAWRVSQESFMKSIPFISDLKIRGSYGKLGNSDISPYQYQSTVSFDHVWYYLNDVMVTGALPATPANPNVKWESQNSTDFGIDLSLFHNKLSVTVDYFNKKTADMLVNVPISYTAGYLDNFPILNAGSISNKGWEFLINYKNTVGKFTYAIGANLSTVNNKVLGLGNGNEILAGGVNPGNENVTRTAVGNSIGQFWGYVTDGLYKTKEQLDADKAFAPNAALGDVRFVDRNHDGVINAADKAFIGNPIPRFSGGFTTDVSYASKAGTFDLSMVWQGSYGNDIYNNSKYWGEGMYHYYNNFSSTLDRYRAEDLVFTNPVSGVKTIYPKNTATNMPRAVLGDPNKNLRVSDRFIEDGSYLRLKTLTIGYTLPTSLLNRYKIDFIRFYVGGKNLLTFTKYSGYDPEVASDNSLSNGRYNLNRGIDAQMPWGLTFTNTREFFLGMQVSF
ncbi:MAG: TonB-dependent receptor [Chitinophaga sp.]|uniref:SusC/RagA family TonB-linked outer membrane protein n=1 Tax=Chitinophaga sp. TaxID=1869181 RepID=UPI001B0C3C1E|nr:TonB-dependent receptor [Chitinophaga sp.]MBO9732424.1 TonB-dependent receptor [Chitinophaga sp.]